MKKIVGYLLLFLVLACDDGDFEVPSFEFDAQVNTCGTYVFYRTNTAKTEAFILQLSESDILQEETTTSIPITTANCSYRIFDDAVDGTYFCADVPPIQPIVIRNWEALAGPNNIINIISTAIIDDNLVEIIGYEYKIELNNLVLERNDEQIIYETFSFGSVSILL